MNVENGSASTLVGLSRPIRVDEDHRLANARYPTSGARSVHPAGAPLAAPERIVFDHVIARGQFLRDLHREKRRAERSGTAVSIILYRLPNPHGDHHARGDKLLELLLRSKRETDMLGHVAEDQIAVLCPDTDVNGTQGFLRKIEDQASRLGVSGIAATYPDALFDSLAGTGDSRTDFNRLLLVDSPTGYPLKRALDIVGATIALILFLPLMLLVGIAIALTSPGPVIFSQQRLGRRGVPFTFYKFRSMVVNGDDSIHRAFVASLIKGEPPSEPQDGDKPQFKLKRDPRVTAVGRFIRKTSIDELPQFFNVLRGDMSLVGPRPPIAYEASNYQPWHLRRVLGCKPGITGIWQVEGRSRVSFDEMVRMDLRYTRECSLALDLKILLRTVLVVIRCDGAS